VKVSFDMLNHIYLHSEGARLFFICSPSKWVFSFFFVNCVTIHPIMSQTDLCAWAGTFSEHFSSLTIYVVNNGCRINLMSPITGSSAAG